MIIDLDVDEYGRVNDGGLWLVTVPCRPIVELMQVVGGTLDIG